MNPKNNRFRDFLGITAWHNAGYTGSHCTVGTAEEFNISDGTIDHSELTYACCKEVAPGAELICLTQVGYNDSRFMSEQIQTIIDKQVCCWFSSSITATAGKDVNEAFAKVKDFCIFIEAIGNWDTERYARLTESDYVHGVGAYHLYENNTIEPEPYSSVSEYVDFCTPTDWYVFVDSWVDGTSCACPILAGMIALIQDLFFDKTGKYLSNANMYRFLKDISHDFYTPGKDTKTGWGYVILPHPDTIDIAKYQPTYQKEDETLNIIEKTYNWAYALTPRTLTTHLILHHEGGSGSTPEQIHAYHLSKSWAGIAYHYYIRKDGTIYRGRPENMVGGHTADYNYCSIGICFEGNFENEYMSDAQLEAGQALVADIIKRYPNIKTYRHKDLNATACPGTNFPFTYIVNPVNGTPEDEVSDTDNTPSAWAKDAWEWGTTKGITDGKRPHDNITREQVVTMIWRAFK